MGSFVSLTDRVYLAHLDMSGLADDYKFGDLTRQMKDSTTFNDGGYSCVKPGLISGHGSIGGFQDFAVDVLDDEISLSQIGNQYAFSVAANDAHTAVAAGDVAWFTRGVLDTDNPLSGPKGEMAKFAMGIAYDTVAIQGKVLYPSVATTADGNGTAVAMTGPTAAQSLYAAVHVFAYTGLTNVVLKVQSDDNSGFSSATDRITFTTITGTTSQFTSVAGSFSSETHVRVNIDVTGSGSATFAVLAGVL